jgi:hypothetical protein
MGTSVQCKGAAIGAPLAPPIIERKRAGAAPASAKRPPALQIFSIGADASPQLMVASVALPFSNVTLGSSSTSTT